MGIKNIVMAAAGSSEPLATWLELPNSPSGVYAAACSSNGSVIYASATNGGKARSIYKSVDDGTTWTDVNPATFPDVRMMFSSSDGTKILLVAASSGTTNPTNADTFLSTDSGATWSKVNIGSGTETIYGCWMNSSGSHMAIVGGSDLLYVSTDSGATWTNRTSAVSAATGGGRQVYGFCGSDAGTTMYISVSDYYVYKSTNSGATWSKLTGSLDTATSTGIVGTIVCSSDGTYVYGIHLDGSLRRSTNGGSTWSNNTTPKASAGVAGSFALYFSYAGLCCSSTGQYVYLTTASGDKVIFKSSDYGATLGGVKGLIQSMMTSISCSSDGQTLVCEGGVNVNYYNGISVSTNGGTSFTDYRYTQTQYQNTIRVSRKVFFTSASIWYSTQNYSGGQAFAKSTNGSFSDITSLKVTRDWQSISTNSTGSAVYVLTASTLIYKSTNGGTTWTRINSPYGNSQKSIATNYDNNLLVYTAPMASAYASTNQGSTFGTYASNYTSLEQYSTAVSKSASVALMSVSVSSGSLTNRGLWVYNGSWSQVYSTQSVTTPAISPDGTVRLGNINNGKPIISINGGAWNQVTAATLPTGYYTQTYISSDNKTIITTDGGKPYITTDVGATWKQITTAPSTITFHDVTADFKKLYASANSTTSKLWVAS